MILRPATLDDASALCAIWNPIIRDTTIIFSPVERTEADVADMLQEKARDGFAFLVGELDGKVQGLATYGQFRGGVGYARTMEHSIILADGVRGRGLGRALLAAVEEHARAGGAHSMFAGVCADNAAGIAFHATCGYRDVARLNEVGFKFGRWLDLVLMQKLL